MSIFKSTFPPFVSRQLLARQHLLQDGDNSATRTRNVQHYTSSKTAWARMVSLVNYDDGGNGTFTDALARKYVLEAGTLYTDPTDNNVFGLRSGVGTSKGSYAGDYSKKARPLGIRPMPGIVSFDIVNKGAFGSLRQATIRFKAWDKNQLDDLEVLFMRTGFWVTLEWGWSMYLNTYKESDATASDSNALKVSDSELKGYIDKQMQTFKDPSLDPFDSSLSLEDIYDKMEGYRAKFCGNYDGLIGCVENFTFELMPDGSYDCTTVLISIGNVLDSLKMNRPSSKEIDTIKTNFSTTMDNFVNMPIGEFITKVLDGNEPPRGLNTNTFIDVNTHTLPSVFNGDQPKPTQGSNAQKNAMKPVYIQFAYLIYIINIKHNLYDSKKNKYLNIIPPLPTPDNEDIGLCLASVDSVSIDPRNVLINNTSATFVTGINPGDTQGGFDINAVINSLVCDTNLQTQSPTNASSYVQLNGDRMKDYLVEGEPKGHSLGYIGNIYLNVQHVKDVFEDMITSNKSYSGDVGIRAFIKKLLEEMSYALGGINDFDIFVTENIIQIIDKNYCERTAKSNKNTKFMLNVMGNNSIVRNFKIYSKIFQSQATEIAIAAQARPNLGGIYTATQQQFNKNLSSRIYHSLKTEEELNSSTTPAPQSQAANIDKTKEKKETSDHLIEIAKNTLKLRQYLSLFLQGYHYPPPEQISTANTYLKSVLIEVNQDSNFRAPIPLSLEVTLDGISGMIIGQIFTVNTDILPQDYARNALGFMVTALQQHVKGSDWTTVIGTKPVLLNQGNLGNPKDVDYVKGLVATEVSNQVTENLKTAIAATQAYLRVMCFVKLYFEKGIDITGVINRTHKSTTPVLTFFNSDPTAEDVKYTLENISTAPIKGTRANNIFESRTNNSLSYSQIEGLMSDVRSALIKNVDNDKIIKAFLEKNSITNSSEKIKEVQGIITDKSNVKVNFTDLSYQLSPTEDVFVQIIESLPDYNLLPSYLKNKAASIINRLVKHGADHTANVYGLKVNADSNGTNLSYIEDASIGQMSIRSESYFSGVITPNYAKLPEIN